MRLRHWLEAAALRGAIILCRALGPVRASDLGARLAGALGPRLRVSRIADDNLRRAFPALDAAARARLVRATWENLGRTAAEMPHLARLQQSESGPGWEFHGAEHLAALRAQGGPALFFSGHLANWEVIGPAVAAQGVAMAGFYRAASNPVADGLIQALRRDGRGGTVPMFAKGSHGARAALAHLNAGGFLGMMVDQKMNDGIAVPFFGHPAMTAPGLAQFALRFRCPVVPVRVERLGPARLRVTCEKPLALPAARQAASSDERRADVAALTLAVNRTLERWIRDQPECWLWLHRRWPKGDGVGPKGDGLGPKGDGQTHRGA